MRRCATSCPAGPRTCSSCPIAEKDRGGFGVTLTLVRDHQLVQQTAAVSVPWDDRTLDVAFSTFRDKLRPGDRETWRITVASKGPQRGGDRRRGSARLHVRPLARPLRAARARERRCRSIPTGTSVGWVQANLGQGRAVWSEGSFALRAAAVDLRPDRLDFWSGYAIGGPGRRRMYLGIDGGVVGGVVGGRAARAPAAMEAVSVVSQGLADRAMSKEAKESDASLSRNEAGAAPAARGRGAPAQRLPRDRVLAAAAPDRDRTAPPPSSSPFPTPSPPGTCGPHAITARPARGRGPRAVPKRQGADGAAVPAPLPARGRPGRDQGRGQQRLGRARSPATSRSRSRTRTRTRACSRSSASTGRATLPSPRPPREARASRVPMIAPRRLGAVAVKVVARAGDRSDGEQRAAARAALAHAPRRVALRDR